MWIKEKGNVWMACFKHSFYTKQSKNVNLTYGTPTPKSPFCLCVSDRDHISSRMLAQGTAEEMQELLERLFTALASRSPAFDIEAELADIRGGDHRDGSAQLSLSQHL